ncbi:hypothetical protein LEMLEM_LOCUS10759 [Lemmus lemmus]
MGKLEILAMSFTLNA